MGLATFLSALVEYLTVLVEHSNFYSIYFSHRPRAYQFRKERYKVGQVIKPGDFTSGVHPQCVIAML